MDAYFGPLHFINNNFACTNIATTMSLQSAERVDSPTVIYETFLWLKVCK